METDIALVIGGDGTWEVAEIDESALEDVATFWDFANSPVVWTATVISFSMEGFSLVDVCLSSAFWSCDKGTWFSADDAVVILATGEGEIFEGDGVVEF